MNANSFCLFVVCFCERHFFLVGYPSSEPVLCLHLSYWYRCLPSFLPMFPVHFPFGTCFCFMVSFVFKALYTIKRTLWDGMTSLFSFCFFQCLLSWTQRVVVTRPRFHLWELGEDFQIVRRVEVIWRTGICVSFFWSFLLSLSLYLFLWWCFLWYSLPKNSIIYPFPLFWCLHNCLLKCLSIAAIHHLDQWYCCRGVFVIRIVFEIDIFSDCSLLLPGWYTAKRGNDNISRI